MIRRNTWVVLVVLAALLAFTLYWQRNKPVRVDESVPTAIERPDIVLFEKQAIQKVTVQDSQGKQLVLDQVSPDTWNLTEPADLGETDSSAVNQSMIQLVNLTALNQLEADADLASLGLSPSPAYTLTFTLEEGETEVMQIGNKTAIDSGYYVRLNAEGPVYVVSKYAIDGILEMLVNPPAVLPPTPESTTTPAPTGTSTGAPTS